MDKCDMCGGSPVAFGDGRIRADAGEGFIPNGWSESPVPFGDGRIRANTPVFAVGRNPALSPVPFGNGRIRAATLISTFSGVSRGHQCLSAVGTFVPVGKSYTLTTIAVSQVPFGCGRTRACA